MKALKFKSVTDRPRRGDIEGRASVVDPSPFRGVWVNTHDGARQKIARIVLSVRDGGLVVHAFGDCSPEPCDWGEVRGDAFADGVDSREAMAFSALYDFGFMETYLQANLKYGTLVIATCNKLKDGSGRSDYYTREFFYRLEGG